VKITVVSPHRGDAAFALGLSIEAWLRGGHAVEVVSCFTRSEFAPYSDVGSVHRNDRVSFVTAVRKREDEEWRKQMARLAQDGAAKFTITDLNLKDAPLRLHVGANEVFGRAADASEKVVSKIRRALELSKAGAWVLPLGLGGHVDHVTARDVALSALAREGVPVAFYEELPEAGAEAAEAAIDAAVVQLTLAVQSKLEPLLVGAGVTSAEDAVAKKRRVALCYDSQIDEAATMGIAEFCRRFEGRERIWANTAWRAAGL
jgi:LmbE family N-acetylglucosaminyl deacetylase